MMYTPAQIAAVYQLHPRTISREIQRGNLRAESIGGELRIPASALIAWRRSNNPLPN
jgi:excisionase family DNA binding protein